MRWISVLKAHVFHIRAEGPKGSTLWESQPPPPPALCATGIALPFGNKGMVVSCAYAWP